MNKEIALKRERDVVSGIEGMNAIDGLDGANGPVFFRLLGAFQLIVDGRPKWPGPEQAQRLLIKLLAARCMPVAKGELMEAVWDEVPGPGATSENLYHLVGVARRCLEAVGLQDVLSNGRGRYQLDVPPARVDIHVFHALTGHASELARKGDLGAIALFEQALKLRVGEPLAGLRGDWVGRYRHTLAEELRTAQQALYENAIRQGEAHERLPGLSTLHRERADDERVTWLYMHALYRTGQQAEALAVKRDFDSHLLDAYGMESGKALDDLYQRILDKDDALLRPEAVDFPAGEAGARGRPLGPSAPRAADEHEPRPERPAADRDGTSPGGHAAGQRQEAAAAPATVSNVFHGPVDAKHAVFGPQINYGTPR